MNLTLKKQTCNRKIFIEEKRKAKPLTNSSNLPQKTTHNYSRIALSTFLNKKLKPSHKKLLGLIQAIMGDKGRVPLINIMRWWTGDHTLSYSKPRSQLRILLNDLKNMGYLQFIIDGTGNKKLLGVRFITHCEALTEAEKKTKRALYNSKYFYVSKRVAYEQKVSLKALMAYTAHCAYQKRKYSYAQVIALELGVDEKSLRKYTAELVFYGYLEAHNEQSYAGYDITVLGVSTKLKILKKAYARLGQSIYVQRYLNRDEIYRLYKLDNIILKNNIPQAFRFSHQKGEREGGLSSCLDVDTTKFLELALVHPNLKATSIRRVEIVIALESCRQWCKVNDRMFRTTDALVKYFIKSMPRFLQHGSVNSNKIALSMLANSLDFLKNLSKKVSETRRCDGVYNPGYLAHELKKLRVINTKKFIDQAEALKWCTRFFLRDKRDPAYTYGDEFEFKGDRSREKQKSIPWPFDDEDFIWEIAGQVWGNELPVHGLDTVSLFVKQLAATEIVCTSWDDGVIYVRNRFVRKLGIQQPPAMDITTRIFMDSLQDALPIHLPSRVIAGEVNQIVEKGFKFRNEKHAISFITNRFQNKRFSDEDRVEGTQEILNRKPLLEEPERFKSLGQVLREILLG